MNSLVAPHRAVGWWLLCCALLVFMMIVVGGATRLTESGLSMVEWAPILGTIPPLNEAEWLATFDKYKQFPEYQKVNAGMSLSEFKSIFWWEYGHRVLGRFIGLAYLLPLLFFLFKGYIPQQWRLRLFSLFVLGGLQGLMGWFMVKSGLVSDPNVSQYRLTAHLGLAVIIFGFMFWFALDCFRSEKKHRLASKNYLRFTAASVVIIFIMMMSGGFVAGIKAGHIMNTFPTMNGQWIPSELLALTPWWSNFFENAVAVQWMHRFIAVLVTVVVLTTLYLSFAQQFVNRAWVLLSALVLQVSLGIATLLLVVPILLGVAHQAGAVILFASALYVAHLARKQADN